MGTSGLTRVEGKRSDGWVGPSYRALPQLYSGVTHQAVLTRPTRLSGRRQENARRDNHRARDRHALSLAPGKLVRLVAKSMLWPQSNFPQRADNALVHVAKALDSQRRRERLVDYLARVEGTVRVLENNLPEPPLPEPSPTTTRRSRPRAKLRLSTALTAPVAMGTITQRFLTVTRGAMITRRASPEGRAIRLRDG